MYRLYITKNGIYQEPLIRDNLKSIFTLIDNSMKVTDKFTKYLVIEGHNQNHGDRILYLFHNAEIPNLGLEKYKEEKEKILKRKKR